MSTNMKYRRLGRTGLQVSVVGLGTWQYGNEQWGQTFTQDDVSAIVSRAYDLGVNLIDTAACYGDHVAETFIGEAVKEDRGDWILATKCGHNRCNDKSEEENWHPDEISAQLEKSLEALQTDYVDILQCHSPSLATFQNDELWSRLNTFVEEGTVKHLGLSVSGSIEDAAAQLETAPNYNVDVAQLRYNRLETDAEEDLLEICQEHGLGVLAREPLASGFLTGKYPVGSRWEAPDIRADLNPDDIDAKLAEVEAFKAEVPEGTDMGAWALAWVLENAAVSSVIPGSKSVEQLEQNIACLNALNTDY